MKLRSLIRCCSMGVLLIFATVLVGCAASGSSEAPTTQPVAMQCTHGECLVCKKNADMACIDVKVTDKTPRYLYDGKTYYFCSDECREEFTKRPEKFVAAK